MCNIVTQGIWSQCVNLEGHNFLTSSNVQSFRRYGSSRRKKEWSIEICLRKSFVCLVANSMQRKLIFAFYIFPLLTSIPHSNLCLSLLVFSLHCQENDIQPSCCIMQKSKQTFVVIRPGAPTHADFTQKSIFCLM